MKMSLKVLLIPLVCSLNLEAQAAQARTAQPYVVYGEDNRVEAYERPELKPQTQAVAAMVANKNFALPTLLGFQIEAYTAQQTYNFCYGQKFEDQPVLSDCTGFLVAPDVLMTAGHCVSNASDCRSSQWVFGYEMSAHEGAPKEIDRNNVYQCKSIISKSTERGVDYVVLRLDRASERKPLELAPQHVMQVPGSDVYMIGYPSGLPMKIAEGGQILKNERHLHVTNLDAFHGNSGAPVFDQATNTVIGILVSGANDYKGSPRGCVVVNELGATQGDEKVTSISIVPRNF